MCIKLLKWTTIAAVLAGSAGFLVFGDHFGSYFSTVGNHVRESVRGSIPVEFEIKRAEKLIQAIDPEIRECMKEVAAAEVDLDHLVGEVKRLTETVAKQEQKLKSGADLLTDAKVSSFELCGRSYPRRRVEIDLERTFEHYKNNQAMLRTKKALIERQTMAVAASREKLDSVRTRKAELEATIASLKLQKQHLDAMATARGRFDLDDSALGKATEVLADVKKRLDVAQKMIEDDIFFTDGISEKDPKRDILQEIGMHFAQERDAAEEPGLTPRATALGIAR